MASVFFPDWIGLDRFSTYHEKKVLLLLLLPVGWLSSRARTQDNEPRSTDGGALFRLVSKTRFRARWGGGGILRCQERPSLGTTQAVRAGVGSGVGWAAAVPMRAGEVFACVAPISRLKESGHTAQGGSGFRSQGMGVFSFGPPP